MSIICPVRANIRVLVAILAHHFRILATLLVCDVTKFIFSRAMLIKRLTEVENNVALTTYMTHTNILGQIQEISLILVVILPYDVIMTSYVNFDVIFEFPGIDFL